MNPTVLVISCEHAVNTVPPDCLSLFHQHEAILQSRSAVDIGALDLTLHLSQTLGCDYTQATVTRLLIDCNRNLTHSRCFSKFTKNLPELEKKRLIDQYYLPFRQKTKDVIQSHIDHHQQVLHLSIHTFTPVLKGVTRNAGIGLLYDSRRHGEKEVARLWHGVLLQQTPVYRMRMNYPYSGTSFSFPRTLRHAYLEKDYLGLEVEVNQILLQDKESFDELANVLSCSLRELLQLL